MANANLAKLYAPEMIPEPMRLSGEPLETYTKKLYDYLRRLQQNLAFLLENDFFTTGTGPVMVYNEWIKFTQTSGKFDVDTRDWRGRILRITGAQNTDNVTVSNNDQWGVGSSIMTVKVGSTYDNSGVSGDVDLLQITGVGANDATISLDEDTGHLQVRCDAWDFEWQVEFLVEGFEARSTPDRTI